MKKTLLLFLMIVFAFMAKADDRVLQVWQADGLIINFNLNEEPKTTYVDGNLVITTTKTTITYPLEKVKKYTYAATATGISTAQAMNATISKNGETLTFTGLANGTEIMLYNATGLLLRSIDSGEKSKITISVSDLPIGVYFVKVNGVTYKMMKR